MNKDGRGILGKGNIKDHRSVHLSNWYGERLPKFLRHILNQPGNHMLRAVNLMVMSEVASGKSPMTLDKLTLKLLKNLDFLPNGNKPLPKFWRNTKTKKKQRASIDLHPPQSVAERNQSILNCKWITLSI